MTIATSYFPTAAWLRAIQNGALVEAHENFQKQTTRNRCTILTANGPLTLVVPYIHNKGAKIAIQELQIDHSEPWQRTHLRAVQAAYRSAPFWEHFQDKITPLFELKERFLWDMNQKIAEQLLKILKIDTTISYTENFVGATEPTTTEVPYIQVFSDRISFTPNLSALDSIFCQAQLPTEE